MAAPMGYDIWQVMHQDPPSRDAGGPDIMQLARGQQQPLLPPRPPPGPAPPQWEAGPRQNRFGATQGLAAQGVGAIQPSPPAQLLPPVGGAAPRPGYKGYAPQPPLGMSEAAAAAVAAAPPMPGTPPGSDDLPMERALVAPGALVAYPGSSRPASGRGARLNEVEERMKMLERVAITLPEYGARQRGIEKRLAEVEGLQAANGSTADRELRELEGKLAAALQALSRADDERVGLRRRVEAAERSASEAAMAAKRLEGSVDHEAQSWLQELRARDDLHSQFRDQQRVNVTKIVEEMTAMEKQIVAMQDISARQIEADALERQRLEAKMQAHERYLDKLRDAESETVTTAAEQFAILRSRQADMEQAIKFWTDKLAQEREGRETADDAVTRAMQRLDEGVKSWEAQMEKRMGAMVEQRATELARALRAAEDGALERDALQQQQLESNIDALSKKGLVDRRAQAERMLLIERALREEHNKRILAESALRRAQEKMAEEGKTIVKDERRAREAREKKLREQITAALGKLRTFARDMEESQERAYRGLENIVKMEIAARTSQGDKLGHAITEVGRKMRAEQKAAVAALGVRLEGLDSRIAATVAAQRKLYARHATFECEVKRAVDAVVDGIWDMEGDAIDAMLDHEITRIEVEEDNIAQRDAMAAGLKAFGHEFYGGLGKMHDETQATFVELASTLQQMNEESRVEDDLRERMQDDIETLGVEIVRTKDELAVAYDALDTTKDEFAAVIANVEDSVKAEHRAREAADATLDVELRKALGDAAKSEATAREELQSAHAELLDGLRADVDSDAADLAAARLEATTDLAAMREEASLEFAQVRTELRGAVRRGDKGRGHLAAQISDVKVAAQLAADRTLETIEESARALKDLVADEAALREAADNELADWLRHEGEVRHAEAEAVEARVESGLESALDGVDGLVVDAMLDDEIVRVEAEFALEKATTKGSADLAAETAAREETTEAVAQAAAKSLKMTATELRGEIASEAKARAEVASAVAKVSAEAGASAAALTKAVETNFSDSVLAEEVLRLELSAEISEVVGAEAGARKAAVQALSADAAALTDALAEQTQHQLDFESKSSAALEEGLSTVKTSVQASVAERLDKYRRANEAMRAGLILQIEREAAGAAVSRTRVEGLLREQLQAEAQRAAIDNRELEAELRTSLKELSTRIDGRLSEEGNQIARLEAQLRAECAERVYGDTVVQNSVADSMDAVQDTMAADAADAALEQELLLCELRELVEHARDDAAYDVALARHTLSGALAARAAEASAGLEGAVLALEAEVASRERGDLAAAEHVRAIVSELSSAAEENAARAANAVADARTEAQEALAGETASRESAIGDVVERLEAARMSLAKDIRDEYAERVQANVRLSAEAADTVRTTRSAMDALAADLTLEVESARTEAAGELARLEGVLELGELARQKSEGAAKETHLKAVSTLREEAIAAVAEARQALEEARERSHTQLAEAIEEEHEARVAQLAEAIDKEQEERVANDAALRDEVLAQAKYAAEALASEAKIRETADTALRRDLEGTSADFVTEIESHRVDVYATFDELRSILSEEQSQRLSHEAAAATGHSKRVLELREELTARLESLEELMRAGLKDAEDESAKVRELESSAAASLGAAREELLARLGEVEHSLKAAIAAEVADRVHGDTSVSADGAAALDQARQALEGAIRTAKSEAGAACDALRRAHDEAQADTRAAEEVLRAEMGGEMERSIASVREEARQAAKAISHNSEELESVRASANVLLAELKEETLADIAALQNESLAAREDLKEELVAELVATKESLEATREDMADQLEAVKGEAMATIGSNRADAINTISEAKDSAVAEASAALEQTSTEIMQRLEDMEAKVGERVAAVEISTHESIDASGEKLEALKEELGARIDAMDSVASRVDEGATNLAEVEKTVVLLTDKIEASVDTLGDGVAQAAGRIAALEESAGKIDGMATSVEELKRKVETDVVPKLEVLELGTAAADAGENSVATMRAQLDEIGKKVEEDSAETVILGEKMANAESALEQLQAELAPLKSELAKAG